MLSKSGRLTIAWLLFALAIFFWGLKAASQMEAYRLAKLFTVGIQKVMEFGASNYPNEPIFSVGLKVLGNEDTITVDRYRHKVYSQRNFIYHYNGYTIVCTVSYVGENYYEISCTAE